MIDLLRAMFATPEAQSDPYAWAAVLMGHWAIGAGLTALVIALSPFPARRAAIAVSLAYLIGWEGGQLLAAALHGSVTRALIWDGLLDWTAVTLGAITAAAVWQHRRRVVAAAVAATIIILTAGTARRK